MSNEVKAVRGMNDCLPDKTQSWATIEAACRDVAAAYAYHEIRMPVVEKTALFKRSIGEVTDIVEKEMYTFEDRNGELLSLRPEGTAGCVRACLEHGLLYNQIQRLWYLGPMFRHERPQKGRTRQFHQFGVEAFGMQAPAIEAEIILMNARLWRLLGLQGQLRLQLNSLGTPACRAQYRDALVVYMKQHRSSLDEDSERRLERNPLRILDSKNPAMQDLIESAPKLPDYLCASASEHFDELSALLDAAGVSFEHNPRLVRGLDYYSGTVFEWVTDALGAQGTVSAGGRYDRLVTDLGGKKEVPAVGFALGLERLQLLFEQQGAQVKASHIYMIVSGAGAGAYALGQAERLRQMIPGLRLEMNATGASMKSQFKHADRSGARWALVCGADEVAADRMTLKDLREDVAQQAMSADDLIVFFQKWYDTLDDSSTVR